MRRFLVMVMVWIAFSVIMAGCAGLGAAVADYQIAAGNPSLNSMVQSAGETVAQCFRQFGTVGILIGSVVGSTVSFLVGVVLGRKKRKEDEDVS